MNLFINSAEVQKNEQIDLHFFKMSDFRAVQKNVNLEDFEKPNVEKCAYSRYQKY